MGIFCCICKRRIRIGYEKFLTCQPTEFKDGEWLRVKLGKWKQFMMCMTCLDKIREVEDDV